MSKLNELDQALHFHFSHTNVPVYERSVLIAIQMKGKWMYREHLHRLGASDMPGIVYLFDVDVK